MNLQLSVAGLAPSLQELRLDSEEDTNGFMDERGAAFISQLTALHTLSLTFMAFEQVVGWLPQLSALTSLQLMDDDYNVNWLAHGGEQMDGIIHVKEIAALAQLPLLQELTVGRWAPLEGTAAVFPGITRLVVAIDSWQDLGALQSAFPAVLDADVTFIDESTPRYVKPLGWRGIQVLKILCSYDCRLLQFSAVLDVVRGMDGSLRILRCEGMASPNEFIALLHAMPAAQEIHVNCPQITDVMFETFVGKPLAGLQVLCIRHGQQLQLTPRGLLAAGRSFPSLQQLNLGPNWPKDLVDAMDRATGRHNAGPRLMMAYVAQGKEMMKRVRQALERQPQGL